MKLWILSTSLPGDVCYSFDMSVMSNGCQDIFIDLLIDWLFRSLFRLTSKKEPKLRITDPLWENPPLTGGFSSQMTSNAERLSTSWRHNGFIRHISIAEFVIIRCLFAKCPFNPLYMYILNMPLHLIPKSTEANELNTFCHLTNNFHPFIVYFNQSITSYLFRNT